MNRFIMANSQQCLGCHACEIACVMAHNDEQHVLSQHHFHPRITVIKHQQQRSAVTCHHCEDAPCARSCPNGAISHDDDSIQIALDAVINVADRAIRAANGDGHLFRMRTVPCPALPA